MDSLTQLKEVVPINIIVMRILPMHFVSKTVIAICITASYEGKAHISLINLLGQEMLRNETGFIRGFKPIVLNTNGRVLENGFYHLLIRDEKGNSFLTKVIFNK